MQSAIAKTPSPASTKEFSPVGRSFVLGLPDRQGQFRIFMNGAVWRIAAGGYQAGERVQVVGVEQDELLVQHVMSS